MTSTTLTFRRDFGSTYNVYAGGVQHGGIFLGRVERFKSRSMIEWTAYDANGEKVCSTGTRRGAALQLATEAGVQ